MRWWTERGRMRRRGFLSSEEARLVIDHSADLFDVCGDSVLDAVAAEFCEAFADLLARLDLPVPAELRSGC
jgi:hypothetical protein